MDRRALNKGHGWGITPKIAQKLLQHSDIKITLEKYTKLQTMDVRGVISRLPGVTEENTPDDADAPLTGAEGKADDAGAVIALPSQTESPPPPAAGAAITAVRASARGDGLSTRGEMARERLELSLAQRPRLAERVIRAMSDDQVVRVLARLLEEPGDESGQGR